MIINIGPELAKLASVTPAAVTRAIVKLDRLHAGGMAATAAAIINTDPPRLPDAYGPRTDRAARRARRFGRVLR